MDLDYCDIEWFALETNRDHSVILEIASKYCITDYAKAFDCVDHNKLWKILKEMVTPDHLICLLRNLYAGQKETVRTVWNRVVPNRKRSMSRLYIVTLLI